MSARFAQMGILYRKTTTNIQIHQVFYESSTLTTFSCRFPLVVCSIHTSCSEAGPRCSCSSGVERWIAVTVLPVHQQPSHLFSLSKNDEDYLYALKRNISNMTKQRGSRRISRTKQILFSCSHVFSAMACYLFCWGGTVHSFFFLNNHIPKCMTVDVPKDTDVAIHYRFPGNVGRSQACECELT